MKKLLLSLLLVTAIQTIAAAPEKQVQSTETNFSEMALRAKDLNDFFVYYQNRELEGDVASISSTDVVRVGKCRLVVLSAHPVLGLYRVRLISSIVGLPTYQNDFVLAKIGDSFVGNGARPDQAEQLFVQKVGKHLEMSFSVLFDEEFNPPVYGQVRAVFKLPKRFR